MIAFQPTSRLSITASCSYNALEWWKRELETGRGDEGAQKTRGRLLYHSAGRFRETISGANFALPTSGGGLSWGA